jgi:hypothetical protein
MGQSLYVIHLLFYETKRYSTHNRTESLSGLSQLLFYKIKHYYLHYTTVVAGVAQSVQCLTTDWTAGVRSPTDAEDFSSNLCAQTGSGAHPASCTTGTEGSFPGGKARPGRDADHSPPSSAEVKK